MDGYQSEAISVAEIIGGGVNMIEQHLLLLSINFHLSLHLLKDDRSTCSKVVYQLINKSDAFGIISKK